MYGLACYHSPDNNLISFYDKVTYLVDEGKAVDIIFLDFSKVFDTVPHSTLLDKLANCEMNRFTLSEGMNRLNGKVQRAAVNEATSGWWLVTRDVPQGSVVGPVLSHICIGDQDAGVEYILGKFANDTELEGAVHFPGGKRGLAEGSRQTRHDCTGQPSVAWNSTREMPGAAAGMERCQAQAGRRVAGEQLSRRGSGGVRISCHNHDSPALHDLEIRF